MKKIMNYVTESTYGIFHVTHLNIVKCVRKYCNYLIVGVSIDEVIQYSKYKRSIVLYEEEVAIIIILQYMDKIFRQLNKNKYDKWKKIWNDNYFYNVIAHLNANLNWRVMA